MDDVRLQQKLEFMERQAGAARDHAALYHRLGSAPEDALRAAVLGGVTYALQTALQAMIDVAYHVCAKAWRTAPKDAYEAFQHLAAHGAIEAARLATYRRMIGFRNRVVHGYEDVDPERTVGYAEHTAEFERFRTEIMAFVATGGMDTGPEVPPESL